MKDEDRRVRVRNALIGIAYGDSFGMPVEMWDTVTIRSKVGKVEGLQSGCPDNPISSKLKRGMVTDDTMNSLIVTDVLAKNHGTVDAKLFIEELRRWIATSENSASIVGPSTRRAMELIDQGVPMEESGARGTTNGGAMKILPVGLVNGLNGAINPDKLIHDVVELCRPTHYTSGAISAACAIAGGGALAITGIDDVNRIFDYMKEMADRGARCGMQWGGPSVSARMELGRYFANHFQRTEALDLLYRIIGTSVVSEQSIPAAVVIFYMSKGDPYECARMCANIGGDTDTMAAMACGICGAMSDDPVLFGDEDVSLLEQVNDIDFEAWTDKILSCR
ncbi:ADP-ribosylglycohydrolase family protein [Lachnoclostridium sp. Marseille-P6806]|uniref:ADP-ribosylglycohydrolase family protein n=1 Tax=Lachnoclostridium sp. Marseille-P6806 TaxID=2364793 RepID=UPI0013EF1D4F|nr:ADP-ribosylglycohydrolase family protein [Lachnoclostridium sp. Marseille-P6806]